MFYIWKKLVGLVSEGKQLAIAILFWEISWVLVHRFGGKSGEKTVIRVGMKPELVVAVSLDEIEKLWGQAESHDWGKLGGTRGEVLTWDSGLSSGNSEDSGKGWRKWIETTSVTPQDMRKDWKPQSKSRAVNPVPLQTGSRSPQLLVGRNKDICTQILGGVIKKQKQWSSESKNLTKRKREEKPKVADSGLGEERLIAGRLVEETRSPMCFRANAALPVTFCVESGDEGRECWAQMLEQIL